MYMYKGHPAPRRRSWKASEERRGGKRHPQPPDEPQAAPGAGNTLSPAVHMSQQVRVEIPPLWGQEVHSCRCTPPPRDSARSADRRARRWVEAWHSRAGPDIM